MGGKREDLLEKKGEDPQETLLKNQGTKPVGKIRRRIAARKASTASDRKDAMEGSGTSAAVEVVESAKNVVEKGWGP